MRSFAFVLAVLPTLALAEFGSGEVDFDNLVVPLVNSAPEPTVGVSWITDHVFYHAGSTTIRYSPEAEGDAQWEDVTPPYQVPVNLDPMLVVHEDTGRILAGGLLGACSVMMLSDDDGETWIPSGNMCSGAQFDHQSVGLGKKPGLTLPTGAANSLNGYYCGQFDDIGCSVSLDGGLTWTPPTPNLLGTCKGFHGHWRISNVTGSAFLPVADCGGQYGFLVPEVAPDLAGVSGLVFSEKFVEGSHAWTGGFDPSIGISRPSGVMYYGMADRNGARIAVSVDEGNSWEKVGPNSDTTWLDVGQFHNPPIIAATFADVQAGDDERAAFSFIGIEATNDARLNVQLKSDAIYSCYEKGEGEGEWPGGFPLNQSDMVWHYYVAYTYDRGKTWDVKRISEDPVQVGGVYDSLTDNSGGCRNLLDFNDMDIDSTGRVYIAYADGCTGDCATAAPTNAPATSGYRDQAPRLFRQTSGRGLFAAYDSGAASETDGGGAAGGSRDEPTVAGSSSRSGGAPGLWLLAMAALGLARRIGLKRPQSGA